VVGIHSDPPHVIAYDDGEVHQEFARCLRAEPVGGTATSSSPNYRPLYREDIVTLRAPSLRSARDRAERHGRDAEISHMNQAGEEVTSRLLEVVDVAPALYESDTSPADLYSRHFRDLMSYRNLEPLLDGEAL
jgi:hypothetical protein